jgi:hypothetical protein
MLLGWMLSKTGEYQKAETGASGITRRLIIIRAVLCRSFPLLFFFVNCIRDLAVRSYLNILNRTNTLGGPPGSLVWRASVCSCREAYLA